VKGVTVKHKTRNDDKYKLTILVPVYNEENTLKKVLTDTVSLPINKYEVIIVDDASKDKSPRIIDSFLKHHKSSQVSVRHFKHEINKGKGAAIQTAVNHAKGEYFVIQDADLEYDPKDIPALLEKAKTGNYDVVYGSRFLGNIQNMPKANYIANRGYNIILRILYGTKITDMHTCYKMVRTKLIQDLKITSNGFDYATELVSKLLKRGINIQELPISFNGRTKKEGKKIDVMDGIECAYKLFRFKFTNSEKMFGERSTTFARFMIVGGTGFITNYLVLVFLAQIFSMDHIIAEIIAAIIALHVTFLLHDRWTYKLHTPEGTEKLPRKARYVSYLFTNSLGSLVTVVAFGFLYGYLTRFTSLLTAALAGLIWNYLINTYVIWAKKRTASVE
jgi:glycosyltransferase involved in cell wall biosynthesis